MKILNIYIINKICGGLYGLYAENTEWQNLQYQANENYFISLLLHITYN